MSKRTTLERSTGLPASRLRWLLDNFLAEAGPKGRDYVTDRWAAVLGARLAGATQAEVGAAHDLSRQTVSQIERRSVRRLLGAAEAAAKRAELMMDVRATARFIRGERELQR